MANVQNEQSCSTVAAPQLPKLACLGTCGKEEIQFKTYNCLLKNPKWLNIGKSTCFDSIMLREKAEWAASSIPVLRGNIETTQHGLWTEQAQEMVISVYFGFCWCTSPQSQHLEWGAQELPLLLIPSPNCDKPSCQACDSLSLKGKQESSPLVKLHGQEEGCAQKIGEACREEQPDIAWLHSGLR